METSDKKLKEIRRLEEKLSKPRRNNYLLFLLFQMTVIYCCDEIASQIEDQMQSIVANVIYAPVFGADVALARMSAFAIIAILASALASFYRPLSDRYGRKLFLIINTIGMGLGLIVIGSATGIPVYILGSCILAFFTPHDMQMVYIFESTPKEKRATCYSIAKACATLGMLAIPLLRTLVMGGDTSKWRIVYWIFGAVTVITALISAFFIQESEVWMRSRLKLLKMTPEEQEEHKKQKDGTENNIGLIGAIKTCLVNRQTRWIVIAAGFINFGVCFTYYYESTMTYGYAGQLLVSGGSTQGVSAAITTMVTNALFLFPVGSALAQIFPGLLGDKLGRKKSCMIMGIASVASYIFFYFGSYGQWTAWLLGFLAGFAVGCFWGCIDFSGNVLISESVPTNIRSAAMSAAPVIYSVIGYIGGLIELVLTNVFGDAFAGFMCLCVGAPGMIIGLILMGKFVKETKGRDLVDVNLANNEEDCNS